MQINFNNIKMTPHDDDAVRMAGETCGVSSYTIQYSTGKVTEGVAEVGSENQQIIIVTNDKENSEESFSQQAAMVTQLATFLHKDCQLVRNDVCLDVSYRESSAKILLGNREAEFHSDLHNQYQQKLGQKTQLV